jgi:AraC-like DNA-binding protein
MSLSRVHQVVQHRTARPGVEAMSLYSNHHFPRHAHDQFGIGVVDAGGHKSWSGIGSVEARPGDVIMVNPGEMHDGSPVDGIPRRWRMLYFDPAVIRDEIHQDVPPSVDILYPVVRNSRLAGRFLALFAAITATVQDSLELEQHLIDSLIYAFRRHSNRPTPGRAFGDATIPVREALDLLHSDLQNPATLARLAAISGVSRFQFLRAFTRQVGITPHAYVMQLRVRAVRRLLANGISPAEAAIEAGFADQSHMTRIFLRQVGVTPGRYQAAIG